MALTKNQFIQYLKNADFKTLFLEEMGWNKFNAAIADIPTILVEDKAFNIKTIAHRNGFQVLLCNVDELPSNSLCKKIDIKLRKAANDYICIFVISGTEHHQWVAPVRANEKREIVIIEYAEAEKAQFLYEKIAGLSFDIDETTTIVDVKERVQGAFSVNSEKITKDFYTGFQKEHKAFAAFISGIDDQIAIKDNKNKQWYTSVMLNRLMFCYFIQKKGFLNGDEHYLRNKLRWVQEQRGNDQFFKTFYKGFLVQLFRGGLNNPKHDDAFENVYGRIPYLNGGMFDVHQIELDYANIDIKDEAFESLFEFFDKWRWHLDTRLTATGKDINPDVLGYIFEQYINDRAQMGAYYTKEDITEYIGRNTIVPYLMEATGKNDAKSFKSDGAVWTYLKDSGDRYIFDAVKKGAGLEIPEEIAVGIDTTKPNLLERRKHWNDRTPEAFALPTEIWRETIERLNRYNDIKKKIENGEIHEINDFITYNLDIRQFVSDYLTDTDDLQFVKRFYAELQKVTILDPTCGSGAFLFAALNILEPLYEVCISRMQDNPDLFKDELAEIEHKYRSNIQYFIYKSIILRNLYGVDIMAEAVEIAKLRLFLKMVAVVEVDKRADNMGLDPLPDIDFNIRCGNTLVGYATEAELDRDLDYGDMFARQEFEEKVRSQMKKVAEVFRKFKETQLQTDEAMVTFKDAKSKLKKQLADLNDTLNHHLYSATVDEHTPYEKWLITHQPFHWLAEFYEIINGNRGFDVIIGNPPYVEYTRRNTHTGKSVAETYKIRDYGTEPCSNLYAFVIERSISIAKNHDNISFIVPLTIASNNNMTIVRNMICATGQVYFSHFEIRPAKLFDGVDQRLTIFILKNSDRHQVMSTSIKRWRSDCRNTLFATLHYAPSFNDGSIWRTSSDCESGIYNKFKSHQPAINYTSTNRSITCQLCYRTAGVRYWIIFLHDGFNSQSLSNKNAYFQNESMSHYYMAAFNSNLFWWYYALNYDMFNLKDYMIFSFRLSYDDDKELVRLSSELEKDLNNNKEILVVNSRTRGTVESFVFRKKYSKPIIDEIDKVLAKHYGFTEEELDFIINYDIKYRMGDELSESE